MATILGDDILKCIFLNGNVCISMKTSMNIVHKASINNSIGSDNGMAPTRQQTII